MPTMQDLIIKQTQETPFISLCTSGTLIFKGVSIPENCIEYYAPVNKWLAELHNNLPQNINLVLEFEYLNTSTTYVIIEIVLEAMKFKNEGANLTITWRYEEEDEDSYDVGKLIEYRTKSQFEFKII